MPASKLNWEAIKAEYISGDDRVTHQALANKYKCNRCTVSKHAMSERWDDARKQYRNTVATKTLNIVSTTEAELRAKQLRVADVLLAKGLEALKQRNPSTYAEAIRTIEMAMEQARKALGITEGPSSAAAATTPAMIRVVFDDPHPRRGEDE